MASFEEREAVLYQLLYPDNQFEIEDTYKIFYVRLFRNTVNTYRSIDRKVNKWHKWKIIILEIIKENRP